MVSLTFTGCLTASAAGQLQAIWSLPRMGRREAPNAVLLTELATSRVDVQASVYFLKLLDRVSYRAYQKDGSRQETLCFVINRWHNWDSCILALGLSSTISFCYG